MSLKSGLPIDRVEGSRLGLPSSKSAHWGITQLSALAEYEQSKQTAVREFNVGAYAVYAAVQVTATRRWSAGWTFGQARQERVNHPTLPLVYRDSDNGPMVPPTSAFKLPVGEVFAFGDLWSARLQIVTTGAGLEAAEQFLEQVAQVACNYERALWKGAAAHAIGLHPKTGAIVFEFRTCEEVAEPIWSAQFKHRVDTLILEPMMQGHARRVLAYGPYGSGKSLLNRYVTGAVAEAGRAVVRVDLPHLELVIKVWQFASEREGAVVVIEDIDALRSMTGDQEQTEALARQFLNIVDGADKSASRPSLLCTSNHPESVPLPLLRPGRLDDVVFVGLPAAAELMRIMGTDDKAIGARAASMGLSAAEAAEVRKRAQWIGDYGLALDSFIDYRRLLDVRLQAAREMGDRGALHAITGLMQSLAAGEQAAAQKEEEEEEVGANG